MTDAILLIEDEEALRMTLGDRLRNEGYTVEYAADGEEGFEKATRAPFRLIILDLMLPRKDGMMVCRDIRRCGIDTPILMLTARGQTADKVAGLKIGADDYVTKPFSTQELIARIEALLRRTPSTSDLFHFGPIRVDRRGTEVTRDGQPVSLSAREFELLRFFIERPGVTLSRDELLKQVWGYNADIITRTVDVHVASLRQKLEPEPKQPRYFLTVQGLGYKFKP
jgi:two-component system alkaline phosphatase synthesis response regulator PhoP